MVIKEFKGVDLDKIIEGKFNQYKLALNRLEVEAEKGNAYGFLEAGCEFLLFKSEVEEYIKNKRGALKGLDELNNYQERFLKIFNETIQHRFWMYGKRKGQK